MNAVIDEDLPRSFAQVLTSLGFTVYDIRDHGFKGKSDTEIFKFARLHSAVLFTADLDFGNPILFPRGTHNGIVILRFPNELSVSLVNNQALALLGKLKPEDYRGNLVIVSPGRIRLRHYSSASS